MNLKIYCQGSKISLQRCESAKTKIPYTVGGVGGGDNHFPTFVVESTFAESVCVWVGGGEVG